MKSSNYNANVQAVFDVFGTYLVDMFYNNHYLLAEERVRNTLATSITDEYRMLVVAYVKAPRTKEEYYKKLVMGWLEYYRQHAFGNAMVLADFQDKILSQFIPPGYYRDFSDRQKDSTFRAIVMKTLADFGHCVLAPDMLRRIIDDHKNRDNVLMLQGRMEAILVNQREVYYAKFAQQMVKTDSTDTNHVALEVANERFDKLKAAFMEEKRAHCALRVEHERAQNIIKALMARLSELVPTRVQSAHALPAQASSAHVRSPPIESSSSSSYEEVEPDPTERRQRMLAARNSREPSADNVEVADDTVRGDTAQRGDTTARGDTTVRDDIAAAQLLLDDEW